MNTKIALVTGGSRGLGRDMAHNLAKKGLEVLLTYHTNKEAADQVVSEIEALGGKAWTAQLDTSKPESFDAFISSATQMLNDERGSAKIDFLINNAGTALYAPVTEVTEAQMNEMYDIHFKGPFFLTQKMLPHLNDGGGIVNISSGLTRITMPGSSVYASMKTAVESLSRYLAKELGPRKIRVNTLAPGAIETDFGGGRTRDNKEINSMIAGFTSLGRVGLPTDIGPVVAFLCTEEAAWINGQRLEVSGGQAI
jgi:NAD(P)-dependent dehydrogenase (short-subunit alcohol dehydrogenase family)